MSTNNEKQGKKSYLKHFLIMMAIALCLGIFGSAGYQIYRYYDEGRDVPDKVVEAPAISETEETGQADKVTNGGTGVKATEVVSNKSASTSDVSDVVDSVMPAIVSIDCSIVQTVQDFWGMPENYQGTSSGSGFIIGQDSTDILIATNNHVISGAEEVKVTFIDGTSVVAQIKGSDEYYDLAVLTVSANDLTAETLSAIRIAVLGDSDAMEVGAMSIAIGNALGYGQSVTVGYVSALNREVVIDNNTLTLLQTDAAINPGNSGGPLLNMNGQVVGINSVKYTTTEVEGMGFAIPMAKAIPIINELMSREELAEDEMGYLGIDGKNINTSYAQSFNMPQGVYVYSVYKDTPAESAGLMVGDIIVGINGRTITTMEEMQSVLKYTRVGATITLQVKKLENGSYIDKEIEVTLTKRPAEKQKRKQEE